jgi:hypothetical protein
LTTTDVGDFYMNEERPQTLFVEEILADDKNRLEVERHQKFDIDVSTMDVMLGKVVLSRTVIPFTAENAFNMKCTLDNKPSNTRRQPEKMENEDEPMKRQRVENPNLEQMRQMYKREI